MKRYDTKPCGVACPADVVERPDGEYCLASEVAAKFVEMSAEVDALLAELKAVREVLAAREAALEYTRRREDAEAAARRVLQIERDEARRIASGLWAAVVDSDDIDRDSPPADWIPHEESPT